jgi:alkylated DNA repair dioxygenase AlkB
VRILVADDAWLDLEAGWLAPAEAARMLELVRDEVAWEQREIVLYGRRIMQPRLIGWGGAPAYRYSGQTLEPRALTPTVATLLAGVSAFVGEGFNHVLVNRYRDGNDSMGMHADDEPELGDDPAVATLSLGATRRLAIAPRRPRDGERRAIDLAAGSLLVMGGAFQRRFRHGLPRAARATGERISLTFRRCR